MYSNHSVAELHHLLSSLLTSSLNSSYFLCRLSLDSCKSGEEPSFVDGIKIVTSALMPLTPKAPSYWRVLGLLRPHWLKVLFGLIGSIFSGLNFPVLAIIYAEFVGIYFLPDPAEIRKKTAVWACLYIIVAVSCLLSTVTQKGLIEWGERECDGASPFGQEYLSIQLLSNSIWIVPTT